jgi:hypothetical protein
MADSTWSPVTNNDFMSKECIWSIYFTVGRQLGEEINQ